MGKHIKRAITTEVMEFYQFYLFDFDHTLAPLNHDHPSGKVSEALEKMFPGKGTDAGKTFSNIFYGILDAYQGKSDTMNKKIKSAIEFYKIRVSNSFDGAKPDFLWSRELWLKYISNEFGLNISDKEISRLASIYWDHVPENCPIFPDSKDCLLKLDKEKIFIVTGSDMRLGFDEYSLFYDPELSKNFKRDRIEKQCPDLLLRSNIITGDPYGKPSEGFWQAVLEITGIADPSKSVVIDDSLKVVLSAKNFGFQGYVLDREGLYRKAEIESEIDGYIRNLNEL